MVIRARGRRIDGGNLGGEELTECDRSVHDAEARRSVEGNENLGHVTPRSGCRSIRHRAPSAVTDGDAKARRERP